jgi:carbonic anhydrase
MRLFESILDANHRAVAGDNSAGLHPAEFAEELPVIALTCVDPRLNALFPSALGLPGEQFIWLRNAGNIITGPLSSTMRSLALACAVKGGAQIAIIGHSDCQVCKTTTTVLLDKLRALGVDRSRLPDNISDFFGTFSSERQNVIKACDIIRHSPLIGPKIPVHGLLVDTETGKLEWIVNGYQELEMMARQVAQPAGSIGHTTDALGGFNLGQMKFPETKIGELATKGQDWLSKEVGKIGAAAQEQIKNIAPVAQQVEQVAGQVASFAEKNWPRTPAAPPPLPPGKPPKAPMPPPIRPRANLRRP